MCFVYVFSPVIPECMYCCLSRREVTVCCYIMHVAWKGYAFNTLPKCEYILFTNKKLLTVDI